MTQQTKIRTKPFASVIRWCVLSVALVLGLAGIAPASIIINAPMTDTNSTGWVLGGNPASALLTGSGAIDPTGQGWLRLTDASGSQTGFAYNSTTFDLSAGLLIEFDYATWGGTGADGYSVYLFDGGVSAFNIGAFGGSLGYAQKTGISGLSGGYAGIGIDEYGNFSNPTEGRYLGPGANPNTVTIRGSVVGFGGGAVGQTQNTTSYPWLATSANRGWLWYNNTPRPSQSGPDYRKVRIQISPAPNPVATVWVAFGYGSPLVYTSMIANQALPAISTSQQLKMGYAASTGGSTNYHEIRNLLVSNQTTTSAIDLAITKTFTDITTGSTMTAFVGDSIRYTIIASNTGPNNITATGVGIQDTVPTMITNVNWTCAGSGGATCGAAAGSSNNVTTTANIPLNGYVTYTVTGTVGAGPAGVLSNTASLVIPGSITDYNSNNNSASVSFFVPSDLSTSTKTWSDPNGGDQNPGDVIPYTITLNETAGASASGVSVTDTFPATLTNLAVTSCPSGATCTIAGQVLTVSNVSVPGDGTASIVVSTTIAAGTAVGTQINNTAAITNPGGPGATPAAPTITVSQSQVVVTGNKPLYLYSTPTLTMSRTAPAGTPAQVTLASNATLTWTMLPAAAATITISSAVSNTVSVPLYMTRSTAGAVNATVRLRCSSGGATISKTLTTCALTAESVGPPALCQFDLPLAGTMSCNTSWQLGITNNSGTRTLYVYPVSGGNNSRVVLPASTVINVNSMNAYLATWPSTSQSSGNNYVRGSTVYLRPVVSDPFGAFDISSAAITIRDPSYSPPLVSSVTLTNIVSSTSGTRTYEVPYVIPAAGAAGAWTYSVLAKEGSENTISDIGVGTFQVYQPNLLVLKSAAVWSDPVSGTTATANPKAIPGAVMTYTVMVANSDPLLVTNVTITDSLAAEITANHLQFRTQFIDNTKSCAAGQGAVLSTDGGATWTCQNGVWNSGTNTITISGLSIPSNGSNTIKFQVIVQ